MNNTLEGKAVLVTGASSGIGRATAQALSEAGRPSDTSVPSTYW